MERFLHGLLTAGFQGSVVILAVLLLRLVLRKTPKKYICLLWLLAGLRLLLPIQIRSDLSLQPNITVPPGLFHGLQISAILPWLWAAVASMFLVYSAVSYLRLKNRVREAVKVRGGWECDRIETAFILGFINPQIYIPMGMSRESRKHILSHERTHLDKGDHWIKMIGFLALALHWFNPLVWIAYILLCKDIEMACDERVIRFMELEERKAYSAALISCSSRHARFIASPVAFGEVSVKQRILSILHYKKPSFWLSLLGVLAFFFVAICLLTSPASQPEESIASILTPEQQEQKAQLQKLRDDLEEAFSQQEFYYGIISSDFEGSVRWTARLFQKGEDTIWTYQSYSSNEIIDGRMELGGKHYVWYSGVWAETDAADSCFTDWKKLFFWNAATEDSLEAVQEEKIMEYRFTSRWTGEDGTVHTAKHRMRYGLDGNLKEVRIEQPNYPNTDRVDLMLVPVELVSEPSNTVSSLFEEAAAPITDMTVSEEELSEYCDTIFWGVRFRVDDDRLTSMGSDVSIVQDAMGTGILSTTDVYWIERFTDGEWQILPTIAEPNWTYEGIGIAKGMATYGYLDWTPIYGKLSPGKYRMGKTVMNHEGSSSKVGEFYSEFEIYESVDSASPEAKAAVERCYAKLEELKSRKNLHWKSVMGEESEYETWVSGNDYAQEAQFRWDAPEEFMTDHDRKLFPRTDISVSCDGVRYSQARENPEDLTSKILGVQVQSLSVNPNVWNPGNIAEDFNMLFFERSNYTITFPEGVGVVSDEMVRFAESWGDTNQAADTPSIQLTYKFDQNGNLCYLEYKSSFEDGHEYVAYIEIFDDPAEEISEKIRSYIDELYVGTFSWQEAKAKYTADEFNIRTDSFVNTSEKPIVTPVDAARLALKEYPNLKEYLSLDISRDEIQGMWKVTIRSYIDYQSTYAYRDVYLSDSGITQLLVYEGPVRFNASRK